MKAMKNRVIAIISAFTAAISAAAIPASGVSAASSAANTYGLSILTADSKENTVTVSAQDVAQQDVVIHAGLYINSADWDEDDYIQAVNAKWSASDASIHFENTADLTKVGAKQEYTYSGGTLTTAYTPYCFMQTAVIPKRGDTEMNRSIMAQTTCYAYDPIFGAAIYQAGENQIRFTYKYYASQEDKDADVAVSAKNRMRTCECICDVQYDQENNPYFTYSYIDQTNYTESYHTAYLPAYDADIPAGEQVPGGNDSLLWMWIGSSASKFFGEASDEFPMITFDVVIRQGTACGTYTVEPTEASCLSGLQTSNASPAFRNALTIVVDDSVPAQTEETVPVATETTTATESTVPEETTSATEATTTTTEEITTTTEDLTTTEISTTAEEITTAAEETTVSTEESTTTVPQETTVTLEMNQQTVDLSVDDPAALSVQYNGDEEIVWLSDHPSIVDVYGSGSSITLNPYRPGSATVYAMAGGKVVSCEVTVTALEDTVLYGDVTMSGTIALNDAILLARAVAGSVQLGYYAEKNADCNMDGTIDVSDSIILQQFLSRTITSLPYTL